MYCTFFAIIKKQLRLKARRSVKKKTKQKKKHLTGRWFSISIQVLIISTKRKEFTAYPFEEDGFSSTFIPNKIAPTTTMGNTGARIKGRFPDRCVNARRSVTGAVIRSGRTELGGYFRVRKGWHSTCENQTPGRRQRPIEFQQRPAVCYLGMAEAL